MRRALPIAIAMFLCGMVSWAISRLDHPRPPPTTTTDTELAALGSTAPAPTPTELDRLAVIESNIAFYRERGQAAEHNWLDWEFCANAYMERARLTGDYADWRHAEEALESSFAAANGFGPLLTRATFNMTMHRIDRVDADLDALEARPVMTLSDSNAMLALRGDARYYAGRYDEARAIYEGNLARTRRSVDALVMLAQLEWHTGDFDAAAALMDEALASPELGRGRTQAVRAWVLSTRAMMERDHGRLEEALALVEQARAISDEPASLDELAAEVHEAHGDDDAALALFRAVAARTSSPQSIDGVARILRRRGDTVAAAELVGVARQSYDYQIGYFPEAAYGHAIDHWLRLEPEDVDRMIEIAEGNARARPYGETRVKLAEAYVLAGRVSDARALLDDVLTTAWSTGELHGVNAVVLERQGQDASAERAIAEGLAPGVMTRLAWLAAE